MAKPEVMIAHLDEQALAKVKALEVEIGKLVVAVEPRVRLASLAGPPLERLKKLEKELGVMLVAYESA